MPAKLKISKVSKFVDLQIHKFADLNIAWCKKTILQILVPWKRDGWQQIPENVVYEIHFSLVCQLKGVAHGLINYIDTKAKCLHLKSDL